MKLYAINPVTYINLEMVVSIHKVENEWEITLVDGSQYYITEKELKHILNI